MDGVIGKHLLDQAVRPRPYSGVPSRLGAGPGPDEESRASVEIRGVRMLIKPEEAVRG
jgi:hypothetical protein